MEMLPAYWAMVGVFWLILRIFFREVKSRGAYKIPQRGPVLFVVGPHANQFIDPMMLTTHVGRSVSFLMAKKSFDKFWIGTFGKALGAIPVVRPQDIAKPGQGTLLSGEISATENVLGGLDTKFTDLHPRDVISFTGGHQLEVIKVISDTQLNVKSISEDAVKALAAAASIGGIKFKVIPHVDQGEMYASVVARLNHGDCVGIFPEGGSHDRTDFLPLKAGGAIMALAAMAENEFINVKIVPTGLNYFNAHKWRSRAVIEFGDPITISKEHVEAYRKGGAEKREAIAQVLDIIYKGLKAVTVTAPDYDSLMLIQAARRLYRPIHMKLTLDETVYLTRRFAEVFTKYENDPLIQETIVQVKNYNLLLKSYGIQDHQVMKTTFGTWEAAGLFIFRLFEAIALFTLAFPGALLHAPIALIAKKISNEKAAEALKESSVKIQARDVMATWKVLVSLVVAPLLYFIYSLIFFTYLFFRSDFSLVQCLYSTVIFTVITSIFGIAAMRASEVGLDVLRSLRPLYLSIFADTGYLRRMRASVAVQINKAITEVGPRLYSSPMEFEKSRIIRAEDLKYSEMLIDRMNKNKGATYFDSDVE